MVKVEEMNEYEKIVEEIIHLLRQHKDKLCGYVGQEPYKRDFFKLFTKAFNAGFLNRESRDSEYYLSADRLTDVIASRDAAVLDSETWNNLQTFWEEWTYAWRHVREMRSN